MRILVINKKWMFLIISIIFSIIFSTFCINKVLEVSKHIVLNKVVIIDAGHGGIDGGAVGKSGVCESHINLKIALKLRKLLEQEGAIVLLTREDDVGLYSDTGTVRKKKNEDLRNRKKLRDESQADLFISIHMNSFGQSKYYGAQTFYPKKSEESKRLAELIQEELIRVIDNGNNRVAKEKSDVYLLKSCKIPMVLVECGFLSNPMEERLLQEDKYQEKIAWSIYIGILRYFQEENKV
ncbi:N-acetylmuramoyl-L-alanine amidase CwlD [Crassaminicella thermophila]|uniref:N-acetylmuramoyl-L-alanine amidase CwlD n=1 Tax=Crassaminicella thermophila TaxID=2599308 RepID=A0A5C0SBB4_CRATE|nr:N-acetylmuramoyl-L-alanine amidase CwlD [Crassaminicella thermophila]QEK11212.1 N-acetylmuramoyl-L-alanine amidase CwlD [Crassaminicella thermophila]